MNIASNIKKLNIYYQNQNICELYSRIKNTCLILTFRLNYSPLYMMWLFSMSFLLLNLILCKKGLPIIAYLIYFAV